MSLRLHYDEKRNWGRAAQMKKAVQIDEKDNVATVASDVCPGEVVEVHSPAGDIVLRPKAADKIPFGHKIALASLKMGDRIIKYGETIGLACVNINVGAWVHTHNVESATVPTSAFRGRAS
jgi:altronate dehydratase small subunit